MFVLPPVCLSFSCVSSCLCVCVCVRVSLLLNLLECAFYLDLFMGDTPGYSILNT